MHIFVDESERSGYLLVVTSLPPGELASIRKMLRGLLLPGERRLHFKTEKDARRRAIVSEMARSGLRGSVYLAKGHGERARSVLLEELVADVIEAGATRLVLDSRDEASNKRDRLTIAQRTKAREANLRYDHVYSSTEPALWISDALAWCYGAGSHWRRRVLPMIESVKDFGIIR